MKSGLKLIAAVVLMVITIQINAQEEGGSVEIFEEFTEQYIGAANNQHLFYEASRKNPTAKSIKFYDEDMKFIKEEKVPFTIVGTQLIQNTGAKFIDSVQVETYNDMLLVRRVISKKDGDMEGYFYDEISWYDLNDLSKPKYTKQIKRLPNFPMMKELEYKRYNNKYTSYNRVKRFISADRIAYLFETNFGNLKVGEKLAHKGERYLVLMDDKLNIIYQGFIDLNRDGKYTDIRSLIVSGRNIFIHVSYKKNSVNSFNEEVLCHFTINAESEIEKNETPLSRVFSDNYTHNFMFALSYDETVLTSTYFENKINSKGRTVNKWLGQGVCEYDIKNKSIKKTAEIPFDEEVVFVLVPVIYENIGLKDYTIVIVEKPFYSKENRKISTPGGTIDNMFSLVVFDKDWNMVSEKKVVYKSNVNELGILNYQIIFNKKAGLFKLLYMNVPTTIKQEKKLLSNIDYLHSGAVQLRRYEKPVWDEGNLKSQVGSHIFQLTFKDGKFEESHIPFPEELKYKKKSKTHGTMHLRSKLFTFSWYLYSNTSNMLNLSKTSPPTPFNVRNELFPFSWYFSPNKNNTQSSFVTLPPTPWDEVINVIKLNK